MQTSPYAHEIAHLVSSMCDRGLSVGIAWNPSHMGIKGNEIADSVARLAFTPNVFFNIIADCLPAISLINLYGSSEFFVTVAITTFLP